MKTFVTVAMLVSVVSAKSFILYEIFPSDEDQMRQLKLFGSFHNAIFVNTDYPVNVLVPSDAGVFGEFLMCRGMNFNVVVNDNEESTFPNHFPKMDYVQRLKKGEIHFEAYHRHDVINSYLQNLETKYPHLVSLEKIGESGEGRDLIAIKVSSGGNGTKPIIFIDAGIHAIEWIASAQALYIIQQLVENPYNKGLIENIDWVVLPLVNPDGYEFTFSVTKNWRKTRSKGINCIGTDGNRNFDFHWADNGASSNECHERYRGPRPFSEPETRALRDLILKYAQRMKLYISFHSFGQFILYPWGYTVEPHPNVAELDFLGKQVAYAIEKVGGTQYTVGAIPKVLYVSSGDSISWAMGVAGVDLAYVIELPPKFSPSNVTLDPDIPPQCIKFVVDEVFQGVKVFHNYIQHKYNIG